LAIEKRRQLEINLPEVLAEKQIFKNLIKKTIPINSKVSGKRRQQKTFIKHSNEYIESTENCDNGKSQKSRLTENQKIVNLEALFASAASRRSNKPRRSRRHAEAFGGPVPTLENTFFDTVILNSGIIPQSLYRL